MAYFSHDFYNTIAIDQINAIISYELFTWVSNILSSDDSTSDPSDSTGFPVKFLNKLTPAGQKEKHGTHAPAKPLTQAMTLQ